MKAAVLFAAHQPFEIREVAIDKPRAHEVLVRVAASGLCHSDYHLVTGDLPAELPTVAGHEAAGVVEAVGEQVTAFAPGDHVVSCPSSFCGHCNQCVSGKTHRCSDKPRRADAEPARLTLDGEPLHQFTELAGFAEQMLVHENSLVRVDRALPLDRGALLGCGVLTGVGAVFNTAKVAPGSKVAIIGCGGVGLNVVQGARIAGAGQIVAVDVMAEKRELARHFGATHAVSGGDDAVQAVLDLTGGGVDYSFEVIGLTRTMEQAVQMLVSGGLMTMVGAARFDAAMAIPALQMLTNEWRVQGSIMGSAAFTRDIPRYASLYLNGVLDLDTLIAERIGLADINRGYETMLGATQARSVITFPEVLNDASAAA